jgi:hypothetical protein
LIWIRLADAVVAGVAIAIAVVIFLQRVGNDRTIVADALEAVAVEVARTPEACRGTVALIHRGATVAVVAG